jgi:hypothetical protein
MPAEPRKDFTVKFGNIARTIECDDAEGQILFTFDAGSKFDFKNPNRPGKNSLCLEHHPSDWPRGPRYDLAFRRAKEYLESCGYDVEIYGV